MVIFHSYVSLPEGNPYIAMSQKYPYAIPMAGFVSPPVHLHSPSSQFISKLRHPASTLAI